MFHNGMVVKLQSYHEKYLLAVDDQESVIQGDNVPTNNVKWTVESVPGSDSLIRLKSCYGKYLAASDEPFLVGITGFQVLQLPPGGCPDSSIEWEPIRGGNQVVQLKNSRRNTFLRANNRLPPWRYSITHKVPSSSDNHYAWNLVIVATTEQSSFSRPKSFNPLALPVCLNQVPTTNPGACSGCCCNSNNTEHMPAVVAYKPPPSKSEKRLLVAKNAGKAVVHFASLVGAGAAVLALQAGTGL
ncbi:hypothetical protein FNV43_RR02467 [Rhamnella rubrinervis]|uniref:DUF569 domain-containing protein n=1 Tax=Rhamnella rubrinervis TaxID=2594499 RepID=A0A8K0MT91_9ROSA|nr:hypothetical protein FNV43_RR02467 [Rhamnella rubrinervis]